MKTVVSINDSLENKISFWHLALFLIMLPFDRFYSELILLSFILHTLIHITKQRLQKVLTRQNLLLCSVFLLGVIGLFWTHDYSQGVKDLIRQSAILLFPFLLSASGIDLQRYREKLLLIFAFTSVITIIYLYIDAIRIILYNGLPIISVFSRLFINHNFSSPVDMHATYMAMYVALSIPIFLFYILQEKRKSLQYIYGISLLILSAGLLQLASRSVLIAIFIVILVFFPYFMLKRKKRVRLSMAALVILLIPLLAITKVDSFKKRYVENLKNDLVQTPGNEIQEPRIARWICGWELARKSPVIGYGSGSEKRLLKEKYFDKKLYSSYLLELNAHNQYLSILIKTGAIGLFIFLATLFAGFAAAWKQRDIIFISFVTLIAVVSFSENVLDVNKGIFFYAFFFSFFALSGNPIINFTRLIKRNPDH